MSDVTPLSQAGTPAADPVAMISALLDAERVTPDKKPDTKPAIKPEVKPGVEAQPEKDAEHTPEKNAQVEGADAEPEKVAEIPLDQLEAIELETTYKGDDGKDVTEKLPIKELRLGYMRFKDYQRKTTDIARQREEVGTTTRQGIEAERTQYSTHLKELQNTVLDLLEPELKNVNWDDLATNNQFEWIRLNNRREQVNNALKGIDARQRELKTKAEAEQRQVAIATAKKAWETLQADIPGWNNELYAAILKTGEAVGYSPGEAGSWHDARAVKLLHKAYLYDQLKAGKPPAEKKVVVTPPAIKPGATTTVSKERQQQNKALDQLRKTGKMDDLANVIASMG